MKIHSSVCYFFMLCSVPCKCLGQTSTHDKYVINEQDTIGVKKGIKTNSTSWFFENAKMYAQLGDSINSSKFFLKISPYYFLASNQTPTTITQVFSHFILTQHTINEYHKIFIDAYNEEKSKIYKEFEKLYRNRVSVRNKLDTFKGFLLTEIEKEMNFVDSLNFNSTLRYIKDNGWPRLQDGGKYAFMIVSRDYDNYQYYFPIIKQAVLSGELPFDCLNTMYVNSGCLAFYYRFKPLMKKPHICYKVNSMLNGEIPYYLPKIKQTIKENCPISSIHTLFLTSKVNLENVKSPYKLFYFADALGFNKQYKEKIVTLMKECTNNRNLYKVTEHWRMDDCYNDNLLLYIFL